ncbi:MAG: coenzyme F420-0:L-glutamate ligase [Gammaproteobacteria bacterium]|nr:coenzyme F420-0:L-glutamate ligase [Gammaproteobacteria bacterium]
MSYSSPTGLRLCALQTVPMIQPNDDLADVICRCMEAEAIELEADDIVVVAQKIVSKAENRRVPLAGVTPTEEARALAAKADKDPRVVQLILDESREVVRMVPGVLIVEQNLGLVMANAGIDMSNIEQGEEDDHALLLPLDPDASCRNIREGIRARTGINPSVIISDSVGRAWRECTVGLAIGVSGVPARVDLRGSTDLYGREQRVSEIALADSLAAAAVLLMGECDEGRPVVVISGLKLERADESASAKDIVRAADKDLFR